MILYYKILTWILYSFVIILIAKKKPVNCCFLFSLILISRRFWIHISIKTNHPGMERAIISSITSDQLPAKPVVDGGWAWVYLVAAFVIRIVYDGFSFSIGVYHEYLYEYFHASNAATSLVASLLYGVDEVSGDVEKFNQFLCLAL